MSNQRALGQKLISVPMKEKFIEAIDQALEQIGYSDRSSFIRDAIFEKLRTQNVVLPTELRLAPSRAGKGGRPKHQATLKAKEAASAPVPAASTLPARGRKPRDGKTKFRVPETGTAQGFGRNYSAK